MRVPNGADSGPDLPDGWVRARLDDIAEINPGMDLANLPNDLEVSFVPMPAVEALSGRMVASAVRPLADVRKGYTRFKEGDVLFAKITPCMENGKIAIARNLRNRIGFGSTEFHVVRTAAGVSNEYVRLFMTRDSFRREAEHNFKGTAGQRRVPAAFLVRSTVPVPPAAEQHRIVAKVHELFSDLDAGVENLQRARALLAKYRQAVLKAAVTGELTREWREKRGTPAETGAELLQRILKARREAWEVAELAKMQARGKAPKDDRWKQRYTEPKPASSKELPALPDGWVWATVDCISLYVTDGDHNPPQRVEHGVPHLTARNVRNWTLNLSGCSFVSYDGFGQTRARYEPRKDDIIITCVGTIGRTAIVRENFIFSADRNLAAIRVVPQSVSISYIHYILNTPLIQDWMQRASGSTAQPHLYLNDLRRVPVPLPSVCEQHKIVELLDEQLSDLNVVEAEIAKLQQRSATTSQSILRSAFSGRLVPQNACDEPAGILLERIRAERAERPVSGRRRGHTKKPSTASAGQLELMP